MKKKFYLLTAFLGIFFLFSAVDHSQAADCPGVCVGISDSCPSSFPDLYSTGDSDCIANHSPNVRCCANNCLANGGTCTDAASCNNLLTAYNSSCGSQVCCNNSAGGGEEDNGTFTGGGIAIPDDTGLPDPPGGILQIITNFLDWLLTVFLILALIAFAITGVQYLLAMGNSRSDALESAKNNFRYAIIAVVIVGAGLIILRAIDHFLRADMII
jgi:hypothetical protein